MTATRSNKQRQSCTVHADLPKGQLISPKQRYCSQNYNPKVNSESYLSEGGTSSLKTDGYS